MLNVSIFAPGCTWAKPQESWPKSVTRVAIGLQSIQVYDVTPRPKAKKRLELEAAKVSDQGLGRLGFGCKGLKTTFTRQLTRKGNFGPLAIAKLGSSTNGRAPFQKNQLSSTSSTLTTHSLAAGILCHLPFVFPLCSRLPAINRCPSFHIHLYTHTHTPPPPPPPQL
ncbi:uncharacterized protein K460DRAFT_106907 [Cucurbitaria berberidis CBS 394.84]|uniref:Uncharacterized protein n=1 Tax=Cucurbitaria berberidis CBS 394.84 TaxID=1168544 RepID=A0A9P4GH30_9PLEO|nr:uncharacterized protein K460DRAFT_106907 [Cucurbitaria berberidis CBS 394.84]KAF1845311.1 hypothetical protein K460DRAFT_106907 [Cucurbitaria berberidis CBS 394.84]